MNRSVDGTLCWLRCWRPGPRAAVRLVCFPHAGGSASFFRTWSDELPGTVELRAVQYPGREDRINDRPIRQMSVMVDLVSEALAPLADRPLMLFGHSLGAAIAYEVAQRFRAPGGPAITRLLVSGRPPPHRQRPADLHRRSDEALIAELCRLNPASQVLLTDSGLRELVLPTVRADYQLDETYHPRPRPPLSCPLTALAGQADPEASLEEMRGWADLTGAGFDLRVFPGDHFYLVGHRRQLLRELSGLFPVVPAARPPWLSTP